VALARLKDEKAVATLLDMMALKATGKAEDDEIIQSAKMAAIEGSKEFSNTQLHQKVVDLSKNDPDLKVRDAALQVLKK